MVEFIRKNAKSIKGDFFSGLTVALALVPEAVAFAFVAGVDPLVGLYGAFMMGLITSIFGGRPGMISGATGAMAVVMVSLIKTGNDQGGHGLEYLLLTLLLVGVIQMGAGLFKLGKFVRLIPHPVMMGFVNGLAIVIFVSQLGMFKEAEKDIYGNTKIEAPSLEEVYHIDNGQIAEVQTNHVLYHIEGDYIIDNDSQEQLYQISDGQVYNVQTQELTYNISEESIYEIDDAHTHAITSYLDSEKMIWMLVFVALTMLIMFGLPKLTKKIPAALTAIVVVSAITIFAQMDVSTVGSFIRDGGGSGIKGGLPTFHWETFTEIPLTMETFKLIFPYALILAAVGLIESLMTLNLIDELTDSRGNGNRECLAQGGANIVNGLFGGMGGCAMIGQSIINVQSGGRGRLSGIIAALTLLLFILFGAGIIEQVPIAALVGVMFMVVIGTFAWSSFRILRKIPMADAFVLILVSGMTVMFDLAIAVIAGVIVSALVFSWENATKIRARKRLKEDGTKVYEIWGPLFFGSIQVFMAKFDISDDPENIEIDFIESKVSDHSGIEAIRNLVDKYEKAGKKVHLKHLSPDCDRILIKADKKFEEIILTDIDDPRYYVMTDLDVSEN
ncbi:MAG: SulP family inorganic anion transporter [Flavobacteriales bacterium]|nr:SulP family inorganic anion transporter [Flavobacteriales bacterium]